MGNQTLQYATFLVLAMAGVMVAVYMTIFQLHAKKERWVRLMRELPNTDMEAFLPEDLLRHFRAWAGGTPPSEPQLAAWDQEQEQRKEFIKKICYEVREAAEAVKPVPKDILKYMVLDTQDQVMFCPSLDLKGSSSWRKVLAKYASEALRLEQYARGDEHWDEAVDPHAIRRRQKDEVLHVKKRQDHIEENRRRELANAKTLNEVMESYYMKAFTKILLVEHPFERLLALYLETIRKKVGKTGQTIYQHVQDMHYKKLPRQQRRRKEISFAKFMQYILFRFARDPHLSALYYICHPCDVQYDYIIKMETFHRDVNNIFMKLARNEPGNTGGDVMKIPHMPASRYFSYFNLTDETWLQQTLYKRYSELGRDELLQAYDLFSIDIFLFNYSWPFSNLSLTRRRKH